MTEIILPEKMIFLLRGAEGSPKVRIRFLNQAARPEKLEKYKTHRHYSGSASTYLLANAYGEPNMPRSFRDSGRYEILLDYRESPLSKGIWDTGIREQIAEIAEKLAETNLEEACVSEQLAAAAALWSLQRKNKGANVFVINKVKVKREENQHDNNSYIFQ